MKNKAIQEQRMRSYFIQATKDILKGEGLRSISVRNVSDRAGYSYATLYNYFKDVNELIFFCVADFQAECAEFVGNCTQGKAAGPEKLKATVMAYMGYFVEYPGVFDLFFLAKVGEFGHKKTTLDLIGQSLDEVCAAEWEYCMQQGCVTSKERLLLQDELRIAVLGLMLFYINRRIPSEYSAFIQQAEQQVSRILEHVLATSNASK